jgi:hypothetical protein
MGGTHFPSLGTEGYSRSTSMQKASRYLQEAMS